MGENFALLIAWDEDNIHDVVVMSLVLLIQRESNSVHLSFCTFSVSWSVCLPAASPCVSCLLSVFLLDVNLMHLLSCFGPSLSSARYLYYCWVLKLVILGLQSALSQSQIVNKLLSINQIQSNLPVCVSWSEEVLCDSEENSNSY